MRPTARERADFDRDGAVLMKGVVPVEWLGVLGDAIERDIAEPGPYFTGYRPEVGRFHGNQRVWEIDEGFRAFCCEGPLRELAARFLGAERLNLFYDQLFVKEPGTPQPTRWHNDQPYWPVRGWPVMSFWLPLDPVTRESGALAFVAGSHRWERWFQPAALRRGRSSLRAGRGLRAHARYRRRRIPHPLLGHGAGRCARFPCDDRPRRGRQPYDGCPPGAAMQCAIVARAAPISPDPARTATCVTHLSPTATRWIARNILSSGPDAGGAIGVCGPDAAL